jgi:nucleotide-binding universal stress UspA family protein
MKILVAMDCSTKDAAVVGPAVDLAREARAEAVLLNVVNPWVDEPVGRTETATEALELLLEERRAYLDHQAGAFTGLHVAAVVEKQRRGEETDQCIARVAGSQGADVVVIASKNAVSLQGRILGSVGQGVLRLSPCPVLVVRPG